MILKGYQSEKKRIEERQKKNQQLYFGPEPLNQKDAHNYNYRHWLDNPPFMQPKLVNKEKTDLERILLKMQY